MSIVKTLAIGFAIAVAMVCVSSARTSAQTRNPAAASQDEHEQTLKQLLTEVRALRLALQRASISNAQFQRLLERLRVEQTHVDSLRRDLENVRSQLSDFQAMKPRMDQQIKDAEANLERTTDPTSKTDFEARLKVMKADFARIGPEEERLRSREADLDNELQTSQGRLNTLNSQLDLLMMEMRAP